jgi:nucleotide-binding universal stress UspA family protein
MTVFKHILVPTDFDQPATSATKIAVAMAREFDAKLTLIHVCEPQDGDDGAAAAEFATPLKKAAREKIAETALAAQQALPTVRSILCEGDPAREVLNQIQRLHVDLLVIGTHGRHKLAHLLLGSVAAKLVRLSSIPVMTVPQ